jgi:hypothetical protein
MEPVFKVYTVCWLLCMIASISILILKRTSSVLLSRKYFQFLFAPWKVVTFLLSGTMVTLIGPYTTDPTWDWKDGGFMSIFAYLTAPWAVGMIYRGCTGLSRRFLIFPALCVWLFSASWSYDIYLFFRDGFYPPTWWSNLVLSSILYLSAGLFWSLDWDKETGVIFSFRASTWPRQHAGPVFLKIVWLAIPFAAIALWLTLGFLKIFSV